MAESFSVIGRSGRFNKAIAQLYSQPVTLATLKDSTVSNEAGTTSIVKAAQVMTAGVEMSSSDIVMSSGADLLGSDSTIIVAGQATLTGITSSAASDLTISAAAGKNILLGYNDGDGDIRVNSQTASKCYFDGGDVVLANAQSLVMDAGTRVYFNDNARWNSSQLVAPSVLVDGVNIGPSHAALQSTVSANHTAMQAAVAELDGRKADTTYVDAQVAGLVASAPSLLNTLNELASAINNDASFSATVATSIGTKLSTSTFNTEKAALEAAIDARATPAYVDGQIAECVPNTTFTNAVQTLDASIGTKASQSALESGLATKANSSDMATALGNKANAADVASSLAAVDTALASKLDQSHYTTLESAINTKATPSDISDAIDALVGAAPETLNTLAELSQALSEDAQFSVTVASALGTKTNQTYTDAQLTALQADIDTRAVASTVTTALATKADATDVDNALQSKADASAVTSALSLKASLDDLVALQTQVDDKVDATYVSGVVSTAVTGLASETFVGTAVTAAIDALVGAAPAQLDTLAELATALAADGTAIGAIETALAARATTEYVDGLVGNLNSAIAPLASQTYVNDAVADLISSSQVASDIASAVSTLASLSYVDTAIAGVSAPDLTGYATETYVDTAIAGISAPDLSSYATTSAVTTAVDAAKAEILGGVGGAFDTLSELKAYVDSSDSNIATALMTNIGARAFDNAVMHLTGAETIAGAKTFSNAVTVGSLNGISSTVLGYVDPTSSIQTQLNAKQASGNYATTDTTQTLTGAKTLTQAVVNHAVEVVASPTLTTSTLTWDWTAHSSVGYCNPNSATALTLLLTNVPASTYLNAGSFTFSLLINATTYKTYVSTLQVNGTAVTLRYAGGSAAVSVTNAVYVLQTFTIVSLPGAGSTLAALTSVSQWY